MSRSAVGVVLGVGLVWCSVCWSQAKPARKPAARDAKRPAKKAPPKKAPPKKPPPKKRKPRGPVFQARAKGPLPGGADEIIFAVRQQGSDGHWYANFGYWSLDPNKKMYGRRGRLCRLNVKTGKLKVLIDDPDGAVRDPQVHYSGKKVLFSWRKGKSEHYHL